MSVADRVRYTTAPEDRISFGRKLAYGAGAFVNNLLAAAIGGMLIVLNLGLGMNPALMASSNSAGGVMGKMISLTSIAVAAAATGMKREDEALLFRFTLRHSVFLASVIGLIVVFYTYIAPFWAP